MNYVDYESIEDLDLWLLGQEYDWSWNKIPWITSEKIDGSFGISNLEIETDPTTPDLVWWTTSVNWTADSSTKISWSSWTINLADWTTYSVSNGSKTSISWVIYFYYDMESSTIKTTSTPQDAVGLNKILVCVWKQWTSGADATFQAFGTSDSSVFITADNIAANTITSNEIAANTITSSQLTSTAIDGMTITGATIRTSSGWTRAQMDSNYFRSYESWTERIKISGSEIRFYTSWWSDAWYLYWGSYSWLWNILMTNSSLYVWGTIVASSIKSVDTVYTKSIYLSIWWTLDADSWNLYRREKWVPYYVSSTTGTITATHALRLQIWWSAYIFNVYPV